MATSYYDAVGLLAICDAIESVEGINFKPSGPPRTSPAALMAHPLLIPALPEPLPAPYPRLMLTATGPAQKGIPQHPFLTHVPAAMVASSAGGMSYQQALRASYAQYVASGTGPAGASSPSGGAANGTGPGAGAGPGPGAGPGAGPGHMQPGHGPNGGSGPMNAKNGVNGGPQSTRTQNRASAGPAGHGMPKQPGQPGQSQVQGPRLTGYATYHPNGGPLNHSASDSSSSSAYRVEECQICGRAFKGPKASTHKQQHIRRLHPSEYTPKRGGKKRLMD